MPLKTLRAPGRALAATRHSALQLDWEHRLVDPLAHGLTLLSVPVHSDSDHAWQRLVSDLQCVSSDDLSGAGGFQLVSANRTDHGGLLGVGIYTSASDPALLELQLRHAVARANEVDAAA